MSCMTYYDEVLEELVGQRARDREGEMDALKRQIAVLQQTVAALASILDAEDVCDGSSSFRARIAEAMRVVSIRTDDETDADERQRHALAVSSAVRKWHS